MMRVLGAVALFTAGGEALHDDSGVVLPHSTDYVSMLWEYGAPVESVDDRFWEYTGKVGQALAVVLFACFTLPAM